MDVTEGTEKAAAPERATAPAAGDATAGSGPVRGHPLGPDAVAILSTEHWSLIASRSLLWNEALNRTAVYLSVLSAAIVALALLANATHFGSRTTTVALVLLPVVLFLGIATQIRLVEINRAEIELVLAMNRLRHGYLRIAPALTPYFSTSDHDDEQGLAVSYLLVRSQRGPWRQFLNSTPTVIATVNAALAAAIVVLAARAAEAATAVAVTAATVAFGAMWTALFVRERQTLDPLRRTTPRFPTPPGDQ
jgi:hypothetical protein